MDGIRTFVWSIISKLVAEELKEQLPLIASWLTALAVRLLPEDMRERCAEEWPSHIDEVHGRLSKAFVALGFVFASFKIGYPLTKLCTRTAAILLFVLCIPPFLVFLALVKLQSGELMLFTRTGTDDDSRKVTVTSVHSQATIKLEIMLRFAIHDCFPNGRRHFHTYPYRFCSLPFFERILVLSGLVHLPTLINVARGDAEFRDLSELVTNGPQYRIVDIDHLL